MNTQNTAGKNTRRGIAALGLAGVTAAGIAGVSQASADDAPPPAPTAAPAPASEVNGQISRQEVLDRAQTWVDQGVPYSMEDEHPDPQGMNYRTDCSGFVSMALHLDESMSTVSLPDRVDEISWDELKPGDIVGNLGEGTGGAAGHVVIFTGWTDDSHTMMNTVEERGSHGAITYQREKAFSVEGMETKPYRYKNIVD